MKNESDQKKGLPKRISEVNHPLLLKITSDDMDLEIDLQRNNEIARDKPPHY
jgi:hypothetical protein